MLKGRKAAIREIRFSRHYWGQTTSYQLFGILDLESYFLLLIYMWSNLPMQIRLSHHFWGPDYQLYGCSGPPTIWYLRLGILFSATLCAIFLHVYQVFLWKYTNILYHEELYSASLLLNFIFIEVSGAPVRTPWKLNLSSPLSHASSTIFTYIDVVHVSSTILIFSYINPQSCEQYYWYLHILMSYLQAVLYWYLHILMPPAFSRSLFMKGEGNASHIGYFEYCDTQ